MNLIQKIEKYLLYIGIITGCFGLIYVLGISNRTEFQYASGIGLLLITISVIMSSLTSLYKISLIVSIGAMVFLYLIGYIAEIDILSLKISPSSVEISFLPITVGLLIVIISDRIIKNKSKKS